MSHLSLLLMLIVHSLYTGAEATPAYDVRTISAELSQNAHAVVRLDEQVFTLESHKSARLRVHRAVTVLNQQGEDLAQFYLHYDPQIKVKELAYTVYDARGKVIKKVKSKEIEDRSMLNASSLYDDNRIKYYQYHTTQYPYTLEYEYEIAYKGLFYYPHWSPVGSERVAVEQANFTLIAPAAMTFRHKSFHLPDQPKVTTNEEVKHYQWEIRQYAAVESEAYGPRFTETTPSLLLAPDDFEYEGYAGNMSTWSSFGQWIQRLNEDRDQLPDKTRAEVQAMVQGLTDQRERVRKIYEYMQARTRYVSIQLGIGGYQPISAATVDETGYGDCKALSNYMKALLKAAGVSSHYTLVKAGRHAAPVYADFPSTQFNHVILCVPVAGDTIWLECTDQTAPFGYLGYFTSDRNVLLVTEEGGKIVSTPSYPAKQNQQLRKAVVHLSEKGDGEAQIATCYSGLQYSHVRSIIHLPQTQQEQVIYQKTDIPNFTLESYHYSVQQNEQPTIEEKLSLGLKSYAQLSSKRWFLTPNLLNRMDGIPPTTEDRRSEVQISYGYTDVDTIVYHLPENIYPEYLPEDIFIETAFGQYAATFTVDQDQLVYVRKLQTKKGVFPAEKYAELVSFYEEIIRADQVKIVLAKTT